MKTITGSWGLIIDLGNQGAPLQKLYLHLWQRPELKKERETGSFQNVPRMTEGRLSRAEGLLNCYSKCERDDIGYRRNEEGPILMGLHFHGLNCSLAEDENLQVILLQIAKDLYQYHPWRMAVIGSSTAFHWSADFVSPSWINLHQSDLLKLLLPSGHPFVQAYPQSQNKEHLKLYSTHHLKPFWNHTQPFQERYDHYKRNLQ